MSYHHQSQFELFPGASRDKSQNSRPQFFLRNLNLSLENLVVMSIVMMIGLVLCFSLGVERGKRSLRAEMAAADQKMAQKLQNFNIEDDHAGVTQTDVASMETPATIAKSSSKKKNYVVPTVALNDKQGQVQEETLTTQLTEPSADNLPSADQAPAEKIVDKEQNKGYTIQVASYKKDEFAQKEATLLKKKDYDAIVVQKGNYVIVCVGKFDKKDDAKVFSRKLKGQYKDLVIRSL